MKKRTGPTFFRCAWKSGYDVDWYGVFQLGPNGITFWRIVSSLKTVLTPEL
jgi:hypothetical protein